MNDDYDAVWFIASKYGQDHERERCAKMLDLNSSELKLMAGEMTAQELRTVKAVLGGLRARMLTGAGQ